MKALWRALYFGIVITFTANGAYAASSKEKPRMELSDTVHSKITALSENGDSLASIGKYREAIKKYLEALDLIPEPKMEWAATTWLLTAIGDANFLSNNYEQARSALSDAMLCPDAIGNPFIHMRLGQAQFELGNLERAADELARAYLQAGKKIFSSEDPKYLEFIKSKLKPPPGGWPKGW